MSVNFKLNAELRDDLGKGASRRLRREQDKIPAIVYGGGEESRAITLQHKDILKALENESFYSSIITLVVGKDEQECLLKDIQRHVYKPKVTHMDFQRIVRGQTLTTNVPLHFINEDQTPGVKQEGGIAIHSLNDVEITCLPRNLPEYIEVDMAELNIGDALHLSDLTLPEGVELNALTQEEPNDMPVASVIHKAVKEEEPAEDVEAAEGEDAEGAEDAGDDAEGESED